MLSLSQDSVLEYWRGASPELAELFLSIERTEDWTLDNAPDIADRLVHLGLLLSGADAAEKLAGASRDDLLFFLVYISSSKAFRLIRWMDETHDGLGSRLLVVLIDRDGTGVFTNVADPMLANTLVQRLQVIQSTSIFEKLLCPSMLGSIGRAIDNYRDERDEHDA